MKQPKSNTLVPPSPATISVADTADYEHWPEDATVASAPTVISGYNSANGLRECTYEPANEDKVKDAPTKKVEVTTEAPEGPQSPQPVQYAYQVPPYQPQYMPAYPPMGFSCYPVMNHQYPIAVPAPAYYGFPPPPHPGMPYEPPPGYVFAPAPAAAEPWKDEKKGEKKKKTKDDKKTAKTEGESKPNKKQDKKDETRRDEKADTEHEKKGSKKTKKSEPLRWQGRTKSEVEEDDMKIATSQGAYDERKVMPIGMEDDQIVWIILPNGTQSVRTWAEAKTMPGEWLEDPRYKNGWFLLCEQEKKVDKQEDDETEKVEKGRKSEEGGKGGGKKEKKEGKKEKKCTCGGK